MAGSNVRYAAIVRNEDKAVLARWGGAGASNEYADKISELIGSPAFSSKVSTGQRMRVNTANESFNFCGDEQGLAVIVVTSSAYPERIVFPGLIEDLRYKFLAKFSGQWASARDDGLTKKFQNEMKKICTEYEDLASKDKVQRLQSQVDTVTSTMRDNIGKALENLESTERLEEMSAGLVSSADRFKKDSKRLKWKVSQTTCYRTQFVY